jgi:NAD kinase
VRIDFQLPRIVLVTRKTSLEQLVERHGTLAQARFYLESRGQVIADYNAAYERFEASLAQVLQAIPSDQRRTRVDRGDLPAFLFAPDDIIVIVGQDGLVPNVAKYLRGQTTIGVNPDPERYDGVLCRHAPIAMPALLEWVRRGGHAHRLQSRTMAVAEREDGQRLLALNEIFAGHRSHQSARYLLRIDSDEERHSSSGVICATGTGSTGWARSIAGQRRFQKPLPQPEEPRLAWFVREPFPSVRSGTRLDFGSISPRAQLQLYSEMGEGGVIFADGIEADNLEFLDGQSVHIGIAEHTLNLLVPA